jgi:ABC-type multidrug transport system ATPase subunit
VILEVERLCVRRAGRTIVDELDLAADAREVVGIVGANGCGKSTLLMALAGVLAPHDGRVRIAGASVWGGARERRRARAQLGYVPELADPPGFLLGGELWALCAAARGVAAHDRSIASAAGAGARGAGAPSPDLIERLGLDELREVALERMSLGQRRRACLGAALLGPPALLVLDEPDNGLDARRLDALAALVTEHAAAGGACVVATHDAALLERLGARVVSLRT